MTMEILLLVLVITMIAAISVFVRFTHLTTASYTAILAFIGIIVGGAFYFLLKIASVIEARKELKDSMFYEIKESIESGVIAFEPGTIQKINMLVKLIDSHGEHYYIMVNDDLRTLHSVSVSGLIVQVNQSAIRFLQESFVDEQDLVNYINSRTRWKVGNHALIVDTL